MASGDGDENAVGPDAVVGGAVGVDVHGVHAVDVDARSRWCARRRSEMFCSPAAQRCGVVQRGRVPAESESNLREVAGGERQLPDRRSSTTRPSAEVSVCRIVPEASTTTFSDSPEGCSVAFTAIRSVTSSVDVSDHGGEAARFGTQFRSRREARNGKAYSPVALVAVGALHVRQFCRARSPATRGPRLWWNP